MKQRSQNVKQAVRSVARETGLLGQWKPFAEELNKRCIASAQGKLWNRDSIRQYCGRKGIKKETLDMDTTVAVQHTQPRVEPQQETPAPEGTKMKRSTPPGLDEDDLKTLHEVIMAWRTRKGQMLNELFEPSHRPVFVGGKKNTGIRINEALLKDASEKAKTPGERNKTGGMVSPLIEYLLWSYLGFDPKYVEFPNEEVKP